MPISFTSRHSSRYDGSDSDEDDDESMDDDDSDDDDDDDDGYKAPGRSSKSRRKRLSGAAGLCHTVIINGPTGAGKTAAVYAIAEELGFQLIGSF
jgi:HrpA-like RNA helicase